MLRHLPAFAAALAGLFKLPNGVHEASAKAHDKQDKAKRLRDIGHDDHPVTMPDDNESSRPAALEQHGIFADLDSNRIVLTAHATHSAQELQEFVRKGLCDK
jgi:hypothetical protein